MPLIDKFVLFIVPVFYQFLFVSVYVTICSNFWHIDDVKATNTSPQEAYFPLRNLYPQAIICCFLREARTSIIICLCCPPEETLLMTARIW